MFDTEPVINYFPKKIKEAFLKLEKGVASRLTEIRVRAGKPLIIILRNSACFIDCDGGIYDYPVSRCVIISDEEFSELFMELCSYSIHSHSEELKCGYITLECGARVGVAATAVYKGNELISVKNVSSLNIRIPREAKGFADGILNMLYINSFPSVIVAGAPNSGKTTLLRDMAKSLSSGFNNFYKKVCIIDERNEFAGFGAQALDLGINTDILSSFSKEKGIELALRTLSPDIIICDEISTPAEVQAIKYGFSSGVAFALSVHASNREELLRKNTVARLIETGEFSYAVMLDKKNYGYSIYDISEVLNENCGDNCSSYFNNGNGHSLFRACEKEGFNLP